MVDETVTVISIFPEIAHYFFGTDLGTHLLQLVISMKVTVIFSDKTGARLIMRIVTVILFDNSQT